MRAEQPKPEMSERTISQSQQPATPQSMPGLHGLLNRQCACGQHTVGGGECESCKKKRLGLQRAAVNRVAPDVAPAIVHEVLHNPGRPLDRDTRSFMESRFGQDFSLVRVHTDPKAAQSARAVGALAYTVGQDVVFDANLYAPQALSARRLLAHELTHVVQQDKAGTQVAGGQITVDDGQGPLEAAARAEQARPLGVSSLLKVRSPAGAVLQRQKAGSKQKGTSKKPSVKPKKRRALAPSTMTRGGTVFVPGVNHDHRPTGRWSHVQLDAQSRCTGATSQIERDVKNLRPPSPSDVSTATIECACANVTERQALEAARLATITSRGLTLANRHLDHYLTAGGADFTENVVDFINSDSGVRAKLARAINKTSRGHIRIGQNDYSETDFQFAFGAIDRMDYEVDPATKSVHIWFMDRYEWHPVGFGYSSNPGDSRRISNCVHAAAVELKSAGAADYWMVGDGVVPLSNITGTGAATPGGGGPTVRLETEGGLDEEAEALALAGAMEEDELETA
jgi:hypothetical protein